MRETKRGTCYYDIQAIIDEQPRPTFATTALPLAASSILFEGCLLLLGGGGVAGRALFGVAGRDLP